MTQSVLRRASVLATLLLALTAPAFADTPTADPFTVGDLTVTHPTVAFKKDHIDVFLSIKNAGKVDETIVGASTPWSEGDIVEVKKDKDGKETESPVSIALPSGKTTEVSEDTVWLRVKDVKKEPKATDVMPLGLYTRRSPNIQLKITVGASKSGGGIMDWLKK